MVSRVDRKPVIYATGLLRIARPAATCGNKVVLNEILRKACGAWKPKCSANELLDDIEDLQLGKFMFGIDEPFSSYLMGAGDDVDMETMRIARTMARRGDNLRQQIRHEGLCDAVSKAQMQIFKSVSKVFFGMEAVYKLWDQVVGGTVFKDTGLYPNHIWSMNTAADIVHTQGPIQMLHGAASGKYTLEWKRGVTQVMLKSWELYKKFETILRTIGSRHNMMAHAHHLGILRAEFNEGETVADDFKLPFTGFAGVNEHVQGYLMMGVRYIVIQHEMYVLTYDDCVSACLLAQCYSKVPFYFHELNGYPPGYDQTAVGVLQMYYRHIAGLIDSGKLFANFIRALHILAQGEFNNIWENEQGFDLGWETRGQNYIQEADKLDPDARMYYDITLRLAINDLDRLNVSFMYHALLGDEMLIDDLKSKVKEQVKKVRPANPTRWAEFLKFCSAYMLTRYMLINKKKPKVGGDKEQLNEAWAQRTLGGKFTMPPKHLWGTVYLEGVYPWTYYADTWHLEVQDVALVMKDPDGVAGSKYVERMECNSELLHALKHGNILDSLTGSTSKSTRHRIMKGERIHAVCMTSAPKAENAKPSWKKRVTFSADNEFRKMQAEVDRNCRRAMGFVRGPSLGVDQHVLDTQFRKIAECTALTGHGAVSSHDISAWSESIDRTRKFEFESLLTRMTSCPEMSNIAQDWDEITCVVNKQGSREKIPLKNSSFQGFDGSECTLWHALILIFCLETARSTKTINMAVKTDMACLIDDCVAVMHNMTNVEECMKFWDHLKTTYDELGFEIDDLKSIYSSIKAIYLGRRYLTGGEVPADFKVYIKAHVSYEDPLRSVTDFPSDVFGAMRAACEANGDPWFTYLSACHFTLLELAHTVPDITVIPHDAACIYALAPTLETGWGFPSIMHWCTNDVYDTRMHFNCILHAAADFSADKTGFNMGYSCLSRNGCRAAVSLKSQPWRQVGIHSIFSDPSGATREGPLHADHLRKIMVSDYISDLVEGEPWKSLLAWSSSSIVEDVRWALASTGPLHAPTLQALVNCMPDAYRSSLIAKAVGSTSVLESLPRGLRVVAKRRVHSAGRAYLKHAISLWKSAIFDANHADITAINPSDRTILEREQFYTVNGVEITDHTFPDPTYVFGRGSVSTGSSMSANPLHVRAWKDDQWVRTRDWLSNRGLFVPPKSKRVWEIAHEYGKGWDQISNRIAVGLAVIARAQADGHRIEGLLSYFIKSWNEDSTLRPADIALIAIQGSIKRLDMNPGTSTHQITCARNLSTSVDVTLTTVVGAIASRSKAMAGTDSHQHDILAHNTGMRALTTLQLCLYDMLGVAQKATTVSLVLKPDMVIPASTRKMRTDKMYVRIEMMIADSADNYGLLQSAPELGESILIPTTEYGWVKMINALVDCNYDAIDDLRDEARQAVIDRETLEFAQQDAEFSSSIHPASAPAMRATIATLDEIIPTLSLRDQGKIEASDTYVHGVDIHTTKISREVFQDSPEHVLCAISIKGAVWAQLKDISYEDLAKIYYRDTEMDLSTVTHVGKEHFWVTPIREAYKQTRKPFVSDHIVLALRLLGITDIHMAQTNDCEAIIHSVASFFGSNLHLVTNLVSDNITSVAGRKASDFMGPLTFRTITNNLDRVNTAKRREAITANIKNNINTLQHRITALEDGTVTHKGDLRAFDRRGRLVELRVRLMVYKSSSIGAAGDSTINYDKVAKKVYKAACRACNRKSIEPPSVSSIGLASSNVACLSDAVDLIIKLGSPLRELGVNWDAESGSLGLRTAVQWITEDSGRIMETKFALSPHEIAPKVRRLRSINIPDFVPIGETLPDSPKSAVEEAGTSMDDFFSMPPDKQVDFAKAVEPTLQIPAWQALFALIRSGLYIDEDIQQAFNCNWKYNGTIACIRDSIIPDLTDAQILKVFPPIAGDYAMCGTFWDPEWMDIAEAEGYTVDEDQSAAYVGWHTA